MLLLWLERYACNFCELQRSGSAKNRQGSCRIMIIIIIKLYFNKSLSEQARRKLLFSEVCQVQTPHILHLPFTFVPSNRIFPFVVRGYFSDLGTRSNN